MSNDNPLTTHQFWKVPLSTTARKNCDPLLMKKSRDWTVKAVLQNHSAQTIVLSIIQINSQFSKIEARKRHFLSSRRVQGSSTTLALAKKKISIPDEDVFLSTGCLQMMLCLTTDSIDNVSTYNFALRELTIITSTLYTVALRTDSCRVRLGPNVVWLGLMREGCVDDAASRWDSVGFHVHCHCLLVCVIM